jgi:hypothetical protein
MRPLAQNNVKYLDWPKNDNFKFAEAVGLVPLYAPSIGVTLIASTPPAVRMHR